MVVEPNGIVRPNVPMLIAQDAEAELSRVVSEVWLEGTALATKAKRRPSRTSPPSTLQCETPTGRYTFDPTWLGSCNWHMMRNA